MRWSFFILPVIFLTACTGTTQEVIEYQQVVVSPACETVSVVNEEPIDVTVTTVDYY